MAPKQAVVAGRVLDGLAGANAHRLAAGNEVLMDHAPGWQQQVRHRIYAQLACSQAGLWPKFINGCGASMIVTRDMASVTARAAVSHRSRWCLDPSSCQHDSP
jgi:hypothetical protein